MPKPYGGYRFSILCLAAGHNHKPLGQPSSGTRHWKCIRCGKEHGEHLGFPECFVPWDNELEQYYIGKGYDPWAAREKFASIWGQQFAVGLENRK